MFAAEATVPAIVTLAGWRLGLFHNVAPAYGSMASAALMWTLVFLCCCSMALALMRRRKPDEEVMILGTDDLARDLCRRLAEKGMAGQGEVTIDWQQLNALSIEKGTTRIVVSESDPLDRHQLPTALIDCKLRGVTVERAGCLQDRLIREVWMKHLSSDWCINCEVFKPSNV
jgi:hypothetical protein